MSKHLCLGLIECENGGGNGGGVAPAPNVKVGAEFQTGRLRDGKVEYGYLWDWGTVPSGKLATKTHNLISLYGANSDSIHLSPSDSYAILGTGQRVCLPRAYPDNNAGAIIDMSLQDTISKSGEVSVLYGAIFTGSISPQNSRAYIMLTYTKTADPVLPDGAQAFIGADGWYIKDADGLHPWDEMN